MRYPLFVLIMAFLLGCVSENPIEERPLSDDFEISLIVGENYSVGEPIAIQLKTSNYSIVYLNRSGGYSFGYYPSLWICRKTNESCENIEYRWMRGFSRCEGGIVNINVPRESIEEREVWLAEKYGLIFLWDQREWIEDEIPCGDGFEKTREPQQVPVGNYSVSFVYWVTWDKDPRSVTADFNIR